MANVVVGKCRPAPAIRRKLMAAFATFDHSYSG
jgi:hypothetical protein